MASSPPYSSQGSPPYSGSISLAGPKKRPSIATTGSSKRRKPSAPGPSHLRQSSFPPEDGSLAGATYSRSPSVDSTFVQTPSALSAAGPITATDGKKRKRKAKATAAAGGDDAASAASGGGRRSGTATGRASAAGSAGPGRGDEPDDEGDDDDDGGEGALDSIEVEPHSEAAELRDRRNLDLLMDAFTPRQKELYEQYRRVKLPIAAVRKLINHTLSQSVVKPISISVQGAAKMFVGELIERARQVQYEQMVLRDKFPTGEPVPEEAGIKERTKEMDRGPIQPDHLREALRRYKKDREGGSAGFLGASLGGGILHASARMGGKKLFR